MSGHLTIRARDGATLAFRRMPGGPDGRPATPPFVLLHATLSTARQLHGLGGALAAGGPILLLDRRGSGLSRMPSPRPLSMEIHVQDLEDLLDDASIASAILVGHSYGGVVALEAAARLPQRVAAVLAYEPPYIAVAAEPTRAAMARLAQATLAAGHDRGPAAAAETFMRAVAGAAGWDAAPARTRTSLEAEGGGVIADVAMLGLEPAGLATIRCPVTIMSGDLSEPLYHDIADALARRIPGARRVRLPGLRHPAPITDPAPVAAAVRAALADAPAQVGQEVHP